MQEAFQRLSNFSADIAHELRTPVTHLLTQTQVALSQSRSNDEYREILYSSMGNNALTKSTALELLMGSVPAL